jgi:hypothetical protein
MIWLVTLTDPLDAGYVCEYTVQAGSEQEAKDFAEAHNPGKFCMRAALV